MKLFYQYVAIFLNFSPTSNHLQPLQVENCGSNSRLVVVEDDNGKLRPERVNDGVGYKTGTGNAQRCLPFPATTKHLYSICWTNVAVVGPALYKCYANVLCLLGCATPVIYFYREVACSTSDRQCANFESYVRMSSHSSHHPQFLPAQFSLLCA